MMIFYGSNCNIIIFSTMLKNKIRITFHIQGAGRRNTAILAKYPRKKIEGSESDGEAIIHLNIRIQKSNCEAKVIAA